MQNCTRRLNSNKFLLRFIVDVFSPSLPPGRRSWECIILRVSARGSVSPGHSRDNVSVLNGAKQQQRSFVVQRLFSWKRTLFKGKSALVSQSLFLYPALSLRRRGCVPGFNELTCVLFICMDNERVGLLLYLGIFIPAVICILQKQYFCPRVFHLETSCSCPCWLSAVFFSFSISPHLFMSVFLNHSRSQQLQSVRKWVVLVHLDSAQPPPSYALIVCCMSWHLKIVLSIM